MNTHSELSHADAPGEVTVHRLVQNTDEHVRVVYAVHDARERAHDAHRMLLQSCAVAQLLGAQVAKLREVVLVVRVLFEKPGSNNGEAV